MVSLLKEYKKILKEIGMRCEEFILPQAFPLILNFGSFLQNPYFETLFLYETSFQHD